MQISKYNSRIIRTERRPEVPVSGLCSVKSCRNPAYNQGYCTGHYNREYRYGSPLEHVPLISPNRNKSIGERLEECYMPVTETGCWLWFASHTVQGYGLFSYKKNGKHYSKVAHRVSWEYYRGPIPDGMLVCHKCDVRACINPDHLFLGTDRDNAIDKYKKGRAVVRKGAQVWSAKFTDDDIRYIRSCSETGAALAKKYNVAPTAISYIRNRRSWKHVV